MTKVWIAILAGAAGFGLGVIITRQAAINKIEGGVHSALSTVGLGGGVVEQQIDSYIMSAN